MIWSAVQFFLISIFPNHFTNSKFDYWFSCVFMFTPNYHAEKYDVMAITVLIIGYIAAVFTIILILIYLIKKTLLKWQIIVICLVMHLIIPLLLIPIASIIGSSLHILINETSTLIPSLLVIFAAILWIMFIAGFYFSTLFSSSKIYFHDSACLYFCWRPVFYAYLFGSIIETFVWVSKDFHKDFPYFIGAIQIIFYAFIIYLLFQFPFAYLSTNVIVAGALFGCIGGVITYFTHASFVPLRYIVVIFWFILGLIIFYTIMKIYSKRLLKRTEFVSNMSAIVQLRLAVAQNDQSFTTGKIIEMITQATNDFSVRLEIAKYLCFFQEFQPQFTAQLAMLRNANSLNMAESFLFYQLRVAETGRQPLCAVDELIPLRDETKKLEMTIRAAWKYMQHNDFFAPAIIEPINVQVNNTEKRWLEALEKYPRNALLAEEYAHFLVECKSDYDGAAFWHFSALQLQDGKIYRYDAASLSFLHIYPVYASKIINKQTLSTLDDLDIKAREDALGQLVESPRLRLEFQRAISTHLTIILPIILFFAVIRSLAFWGFWVYLGSSYIHIFSNDVDRMSLIKKTTDISEKSTLSMLGFALQLANLSGALATAEEMEAIIGTDRINTTKYIIDPHESYLLAAHEYTEDGTDDMVDVYNGIINSVLHSDDMHTPVKKLFEQKYTVSYTNSSQRMIQAGNESLAFIFANYMLNAHITASVSTENILDNPVTYDCLDLAGIINDNIYNFASSFIPEKNYKVGEFSTKTFAAIVLVYAVVFILGELILFILNNRKMAVTMCACKKFTQETFDKVSSNIFIAQITTDAPNLTASISKTTRSRIRTAILYLVEFIITIVLLILMVFFILYTRERTEYYYSLSYTLLNAAKRKTKSVEILYSLMISNILRRSRGNIRQISMQYNMRMRWALNNLTEAHEQCASGYYGRGSVKDEISKIREDSPCDFDMTNSTYHETYSCLSLDSGVSAFYNMVQKLQQQFQSNTMFQDEDFIYVYDYLNTRLYFMMEEVIELILEQGSVESEDNDAFIISLSAVGTVFTIVLFILAVYRYSFLKRNYRSMINLILRAPPTDAVANDDLMMILLNRRMSQKLAKMSETATLLANTSHPLIFTTNDGIIVNVNSAFQILFNYEVSHIVGQNISLITDIDKLSPVYNHEKMKTPLSSHGARSNRTSRVSQKLIQIEEEKNNSMVFDTFSSKFRRENGQEIECSILPMLVGHDSKNKLYAFVITDLSSVLAKQKKVNILKSCNDVLNENIKPSILNSESVTVSGATVCTIRLVMFSNTLAPAAIMQQRKTLLSKIDECLKKYDMLHRLFFAQGMFAIISNDKEAAIHIFRYIDDVLSSFDDPTFFGEITIGVDTDDSVCISESKLQNKETAVIGKVFDNAARLSMIGNAGTAYITEAVYNQIASIGSKFVSKKDPIIGNYYAVEPLER